MLRNMQQERVIQIQQRQQAQAQMQAQDQSQPSEPQMEAPGSAGDMEGAAQEDQLPGSTQAAEEAKEA